MPPATGADLHSRGEGLAWSQELDLAGLLAAIGATQLGEADDEQAAAEDAAALDQGTARDVTGAVADQLPAGPGLAAWISSADPRAVPEFDLPGLASAYRRVAAWAQAGELAAVAEMASQAAVRDDRVRVDDDGRPDQVTPAAASTVGLELVMSHPTAMDWTHLAVTLRWKLPATLAALRAGTIDLYRARLIAEATGPLDDVTARAVESKIILSAGDWTSGQLRAALRRAVIAADPEAAEQRRKQAQRHAKISLYPDPATGTATLTGSRLPSVHAAAAMARLTSIARAMKSAGMTGGLDFLRANAFIGLLLGTLPLVPPPDSDPGPAGPTDPDAGPSPSDPSPGGSGCDDSPERAPSFGDPGPGDLGDANRGDADGHGDPRPEGPVPPDPAPPDPAPPGPSAPDLGRSDPGPPGDPDGAGWTDADFDGDWDEGPSAAGPPAPWPPLPATSAQTPPFLGRPPPRHPARVGRPPPRGDPPPGSHPPRGRPGQPRRGRPTRPPPGLLEIVISWRALTGDPAGPATLSRVGPITAAQALPLALTAAADLHARWQVIVTDSDGYAVAVETVRRRYRPGRAGRPAGVTGLVAVTIPAAVLDRLQGPGPDDTAAADSGTGTGVSWTAGGIRAAVLRAARRALARARQQAAADAAAPGGCAHTTATTAYRPTQKIRDFVTARDQTCRNPRCRQPARHADVDHTIAWHKGGPTCQCNLGPYCRVHHQVKQLLGWTLTQTRPGHFQLTTPAGRSYRTAPDPYPD
ncbi:MAG TPA: DUF222 domain-containing protein [Streptosporangiaceae bacterium]|nr:DUF222 domain-containing protein [Streptosporangiaceae bacterium]